MRVRVNFNSDPQGASVVGSDGVVLGKTPLSTEIPYGNAPVGYRMIAISDAAMARHYAADTYYGCVTPDLDTWT